MELFLFFAGCIAFTVFAFVAGNYTAKHIFPLPPTEFYKDKGDK